MNSNSAKSFFAVVSLCAVVSATDAAGEGKVLRPEFEKTGHVPPQTTTPEPRSSGREYVDLAVMVVALGIAAWLSLKVRSRRGIVMVSLVCLAYFGFFRKGCVCPVGSFQNIINAFTDSEYAIPLAVTGFFLLPLIFALFFGRVFCGAVCPLGAVQDVVLLRPVKAPRGLSHILEMVPFVYLGLAVMFVACGAGYIVCRYDPFVGFFRLGGGPGMLAFGAFLLLLGVFAGRPYCRFLCPYGVLLGWMSVLSKYHASITPDECIECRLCSDACPFDAISAPSPEKNPEPRDQSVKRLFTLALLLPALAVSLGWLGSLTGKPLSRFHRTVSLADQVRGENTGKLSYATFDSDKFREMKGASEELFAEASQIEDRFVKSGWFLGGFLGIVFSVKLIALSLSWKREGYQPDRRRCFSCGRCFDSCPKERIKRAPAGREMMP